MFASVVDGFYLGTATEILFYSGNTPNEFSRKVVANYSVIEGSSIEVMMSQVGETEEGGKAILMATKEGLSVGFKGGNFINFSEDKVQYPAANFGAGIFKDRKYIVALQT